MTLQNFSKLLLILSIGFTTPMHAKEYIAKVKGNKSAFAKSIPSIRSIDGVYIKDTNSQGNLLKVVIDTSSNPSAAKKIAALMQRSDIEYVVENTKFYALGTPPNDARFSEQWALEKVKAVGAWSLTKTANNVVVAVIDTGVDARHEDLAGNIWTNSKEIAGNGKDDDNNGFIDDVGGWDFYQNDNTPNDETSAQNPGHGTHCAGIIGAVRNNSVGVTGIGQGISIMPIRFLGADGSGDLFASTKAIDYAIQNGAQVISASWGAAVPKSAAQPIIDAIERANQKGVVFVTAAGNDGASNDHKANYPANAGTANTISVAASDASDKKPQWSNYGMQTVDLAAPGADILSTMPGNKYGKLSGTSMATPLVAGLVGLLKSQDASLTPSQIRSILQSSGAKVDIKTACNCRIDAEASTRVVSSKALTVIPAAASLGIGANLQFGVYGGNGPYTYKSSDPDVASIDASGKLTTIKEGDVTVSVEDADGNKASSLGILVGRETPPDEGGSGDCPLGEPMLCAIICQIMPTAPWCEGGGGGDDDEGGMPGWPDLPEFPGMSHR